MLTHVDGEKKFGIFENIPSSYLSRPTPHVVVFVDSMLNFIPLIQYFCDKKGFEEIIPSPRSVLPSRRISLPLLKQVEEESNDFVIDPNPRSKCPH
jgi:hypothetical protein